MNRNWEMQLSTHDENGAQAPASGNAAPDLTDRVLIENALRASEERFRELLGSLHEIVWCYSVNERKVIYVNDAVEGIYGRSKEEFLANPKLWRTAIHPDDRDMAGHADQLVLETGQAACDCRIVDAADHLHWLHFRLYRVGDAASASGQRVVGVGIDITARKRAELALTESEELFLTTMGAAQVGIFVVQDSKLAYVNPLIPRMFGYRENEMVGMAPFDLVAPELRESVVQEQRSKGSESSRSFETVAVRKDGSTFPAMVLAAPTSYKGRPAWTGTIFDLTERKQAEKRIIELAFFDPLTGLPNRRLLEDRVGQAVAEAERKKGSLALLVLDLDKFKRVNDSLGHGVGDQLLCSVATRIKKVVRKTDTIARMSGDEFVFVLPGSDAEGAAEMARSLINACAQPFIITGHELTVTPSIGISLYPTDGQDFEHLYKNADLAMYQVKEDGRQNYQFYSQSMNSATLEHLFIEHGLRNALAADQFLLVYQPLVLLRTGHIVGCEALIRWQHPELGLIQPIRFIPVAEDSGLINSIGEWVLRKACWQAKAWQDAGLPLQAIAVNVSPVQFRQSRFVEMVAEILQTSGLPASCLELELTERTVMHDAEVNLGTLSALSKMGVELAVDDFGTGYSSLAYLKRFPVGKLKIDQSFVRDIAEDRDDLAIAETIVSIGHSLRLNVLAEGVETEEQLNILEEGDSDMAQGYLFSVPLPADEFAEMLRQQPFEKADGKWKEW
ncbi:MAG: hypothetical protein H6R18_36 [Proteobacteria bacterium]|nr:hypothetical protein [Pseudomonadota bacterium]